MEGTAVKKWHKRKNTAAIDALNFSTTTRKSSFSVASD
jgi:hypothetical protein